jgi:hypothetical protein
LTVVLVLAAAAYLYGVHRLHARGDRWPVARSWLFCGAGLGSIALVTVSGLEAYDSTLLSAHMVQHMVLTMVAPIFLAVGAPLTLALRTLPRRGRRALLAVLHSLPVRVLTFPLVLGSGKRLFDEGAAPTALEVVDSLLLPSGVVYTALRPGGAPTFGDFTVEDGAMDAAHH